MKNASFYFYLANPNQIISSIFKFYFKKVNKKNTLVFWFFSLLIAEIWYEKDLQSIYIK